MNIIFNLLITYSYSLMSEISKARQRMLHKRDGSRSPDEATEKPYPRKFTLSSLTQQLEHRPSQPNIHKEFERSPTSQPYFPQYARTQRSKTELSRPDANFNLPQEEFHYGKMTFETPEQTSKTQKSFRSKSKENPPLMLKTVNIKIEEINHLNPLSQVSQDEEFEMDSHFQESPPRVQYKRKLHRDKLEIILAPPFQRRHHSPFKPRQTLKKWAEETIAEARTLGKSFVDDYFPPARTIVFNRKILYQEEGLKFEHLYRIYNCQIKLVASCEPTLLSLGKYTNPYLYSALSILSQDPMRVLSLFGNQHASEEGAYHVCLCKDGTWRYIVIDDFMPIKSIAGRKQMLFIHSRQDDDVVEIWPALVEKAVAKVYGTYLDLAMIREEGMSDLFKLLTGAPVSTYPLNKDFRSFLIIIDAALKRGHVVTVEAIHEEHAETAKLRNLALHQAYKVLEIKKSGLKLRNYSQPELTTKLTFAECLIFSTLVIYRLEPSFRYISYKLRHKKGFYSKLKLRVPNTSRGYFDCWQNNPAYYKKHLGSNIEYSVSRVRMWLTRDEEEEGEWLQPGKEVILDEGEYELKIHLCQEKQYDFTMSYYGEKDILMERQKCREEWKEPCLCISK